MASEPDAYLRRVERERRQREDVLLILLLTLIDRARLDATTAALHGFSFAQAIRQVIAGGPQHKGAAPMIARTMAQAHRDGYRRVGLAAGTRDVQRSDAGALAELAALYLPAAQQAAQAMAQTLSSEVAEGLLAVPTGLTVREAIRQSFSAAGYTKEHAHAIDMATERAVVSAHSNGVLAAALSGAVEVTGLEHVSILDEGTTDICQERHGLRLPVDHWYWRTNIPQLHFRCRSTLRPLLGEFTPSERLPVIPPMPGFGMNPVPFIQAAQMM